METWATFSIIDHRQPVYRQALALFDRIVVPVPPQPIGDQTPEELEQLREEVKYLVEHGAAVRREWSSDSFQEWRKPRLAAAIAAGVNRDPYMDTRLMLAEQFDSNDVQAVPVYGGGQQFTESQPTSEEAQQTGLVEQALTVEVMQRLPVPEYDTPLESLIRLRQNSAFRTALDDLLEWKRAEVPAIVLAPNRATAIAAAMGTFDKLTIRYAEAMESEGFKKLGSVGSIFFAILTGEPVAAIKETLVSFREIREPCWKKMSEMKCAPGGVVYHFREALGAA
jgi:hypothetical protein